MLKIVVLGFQSSFYNHSVSPILQYEKGNIIYSFSVLTIQARDSFHEALLHLSRSIAFSIASPTPSPPIFPSAHLCRSA